MRQSVDEIASAGKQHHAAQAHQNQEVVLALATGSDLGDEVLASEDGAQRCHDQEALTQLGEGTAEVDRADGALTVKARRKIQRHDQQKRRQRRQVLAGSVG